MADILIRGMEMPRDGRKHTAVIQFLEDGKCRAIVEYSKSYDDRSVKVYEAVPIQEGHGRLGDLEIAEAILHNKAFDLAGTSAEYNALNWALRQIMALPTIVPAEGGTDECSEN